MVVICVPKLLFCISTACVYRALYLTNSPISNAYISLICVCVYLDSLRSIASFLYTFLLYSPITYSLHSSFRPVLFLFSFVSDIPASRRDAAVETAPPAPARPRENHAQRRHIFHMSVLRNVRNSYVH